MTRQERLAELGITLPQPPTPVGSYVPGMVLGDVVMTSGQLPMCDGTLVAEGKVGDVVTLTKAAEAARVCVLNALAIVADMAGGLDAIEQIVRVGVYVNSGAGFTDQAKVANGASDLLVEIFGDAGRHVRAAVGVSELPLNAAVELELTAKIAK